MATDFDQRLVKLPVGTRPQLLVYVDAEEEFDWSRPFSSDETRVSNLSAQGPAIEIMARHRLKPTFLVDYPVADQEVGAAPVRELLRQNLVDIGAQLHPWVTPPHIEFVNEINSFPGNLPPVLEFSKLQSLTQRIEEQFGVKPLVYRAGRYGLGESTAQSLHDLGYRIDCSVYPGRSFAERGGPDFRDFPSAPYWIDQIGGLLEVPLTAGYLGLMQAAGAPLNAVVWGRLGRAIRLPSVLRHLGLLEQSWLTPEGVSLDEAKRLTRGLLSGGQRVFSISYHSPSLVPGHTPYVRTDDDLRTFIGWLSGYLEFFFTELNGEAATPQGVYGMAMAGSHEDNGALT